MMKFRTRSRARSVGVSSAIVFLLAGGVAACSSDADGDSPGGDAPGGGSEPVASDELELSALDVSDEVAEELQSLYQERSEEHTSELQSRGHLVCRLLLEKKKLQM